MKKINGVTSLDEVNVKANKAENVNPVIARVITLLRRRHKLRPTQSNDFHIRSQEAVLEMQMDTQDTFRILLASIAGISLLVGGIGIMNIMLVTVTERTREIGIRKAIGASRGVILRQFLFESVVICLIGCGIGIFMSWLLLKVGSLITASLGVVFGMDPTIVILAVSFCFIIGILFGLYPANKAAKMKPIDALHYGG